MNRTETSRLTPTEADACAAVLEWRTAVDADPPTNGDMILAALDHLSRAADALNAERSKP